MNDEDDLPTSLRDVDKTPFPPTKEHCVVLLWREKIEAVLTAKIKRFQHHAVICRVFRKRPNRGELRDLLQAYMLDEINKIYDIQILEQGFYQWNHNLSVKKAVKE